MAIINTNKVDSKDINTIGSLYSTYNLMILLGVSNFTSEFNNHREVLHILFTHEETFTRDDVLIENV